MTLGTQVKQNGKRNFKHLLKKYINNLLVISLRRKKYFPGCEKKKISEQQCSTVQCVCVELEGKKQDGDSTVPDRAFHDFRASKSANRPFFCSSRTLVTGCWGSEIEKCLVGRVRQAGRQAECTFAGCLNFWPNWSMINIWFFFLFPLFSLSLWCSWSGTRGAVLYKLSLMPPREEEEDRRDNEPQFYRAS